MSSEYTGRQYDPWRQPVWGWAETEGVLDLTCPHCGGELIVKKEQWLRGRIPAHYDHQEIFAVLRACPFCTRLARIPIQLRRKRRK